MTLVITHANGYLGCFTQEPDGSMRQRALIDTGAEPPTAVDLATIGTRLAHEYGWQLNGTVPVKGKALPKKAKALPVNKRKALRDPDMSGDPRPAERPPLIMDYLARHPNSSIREIIEGLGFEATDLRAGRWSHTFKALIASGEITRRSRESDNYRTQEYALRGS